MTKMSFRVNPACTYIESREMSRGDREKEARRNIYRSYTCDRQRSRCGPRWGSLRLAPIISIFHFLVRPLLNSEHKFTCNISSEMLDIRGRA